MQTVVAPTGIELEAIDRKQRAAWLDEGIHVFESKMSELLGREIKVCDEMARLWTHPCHLRLTQPESGDMSTDTDWHRARDCITGSRAGSVFGYSPYSNRWEIFREITGLAAPQKSSPPMEHGKFYENPSLAKFEKLTGKVVMPFDFFKIGPVPGTTIQSVAYSPDGFTTDGEMIESKAPFSLFLGSRKMRPGFIPFHYGLGQIQYGMWLVSYITLKPIDTTYYMEYLPPPGFSFLELETLAITKTTRDPDWVTSHVWVIEEFSQEIEDFRASGGVIPPHYAGTKKQWEVFNHNRRIHQSDNRVWPKTLKALECADEIENPLFAKKKRPYVSKRKQTSMSIDGDDNGDADDISWDSAAWGMTSSSSSGGGGGKGGCRDSIDSMVTW